MMMHLGLSTLISTHSVFSSRIGIAAPIMITAKERLAMIGKAIEETSRAGVVDQ
jgi:hypothetical protein